MILADTSDTRDFLKLFLWQAERHANILATLHARMSVSASASWNASFKQQRRASSRLSFELYDRQTAHSPSVRLISLSDRRIHTTDGTVAGNLQCLVDSVDVRARKMQFRRQFQRRRRRRRRGRSEVTSSRARLSAVHTVPAPQRNAKAHESKVNPCLAIY